MADSLKLRAETGDDLGVISSVLQDAILRVGEIRYDRKARALTLRLTRFRHEADTPTRILAGLRIDSVLSVASRGLERDNADALAVLMSMTYVPNPNVSLQPEGKLHMILAGGGEIVCDVECVDVMLADVSAPRETKSQPLHPDD